MQNGPGHKKRDGGEPPVDIVDAFVKIETVASPVAYWFSIALAAVIAVIGAAVVNALRQDGESWGVVAIAGVAIGALAALVYFVGWGWRWLFTRRIDHLFGKAKFSSEAKEPPRQRWARRLWIVGWV